MCWYVVSFFLGWFTEIDPKDTRSMGSTSLSQYSNVPTIFGFRFYIILVLEVMCTLCVTVVVLYHRWVAPTYVVNIFASVIFCVDIYVGILHIYWHGSINC